jgi:hypothetical protein
MADAATTATSSSASKISRSTMPALRFRFFFVISLSFRVAEGGFLSCLQYTTFVNPRQEPPFFEIRTCRRGQSIVE